MKKLKEWFSIQLAKNPGRIVIIAILLFNVAFLFVSALIIRSLSLQGTEQMGFFEAAFYTVTMILDAGCISFVIEDIGQSGVAIAVICLIIIVIGMVSFTGAVIGYITNYISSFVSASNSDSRKLNIEGHFVILNWNTRASEIINDLLYCRKRQVVVVLTDSRKTEIQKEVEERLSDTVHRENVALRAKCKELGFFKGNLLYLKEHLKNRLTVIIREGDVYSAKQLHDISLEYARSIVILGNDKNNAVCKYEEKSEELTKGNAQTVRTLMQVSDITSAQYSADNQKIIVEISDDWTWDLVDKIIKYKRVAGKCNIVPVRVNQILGQILSQFPLMPELNLAYRELFSNKGATFFLEEKKVDDDINYVSEYLKSHSNAIPLSSMSSDGKDYFFYVAESQKDIEKVTDMSDGDFSVKLNRDYWIERKNVIILGHNSKSKDIMQGFEGFCDEWGRGEQGKDILRITVIDDQKSLEKMDFYRDYPFVIGTVAASIFDRELICSTIESIVDSNEEDTSVLILSDDSASNENVDAAALANLIYVQDIISERRGKDPNFDVGRIDVVVELINPKHHDIVSSYSVNNVVISNRYISKMITQIGEKEAIFDFYADILTYDTADAEVCESKEVYAKKVSTFFAEIPGECTAAQLIRAVWQASVSDDIPKEKQNPTLTLGYVKSSGEIVLFDGNQLDMRVKLESTDKLLVYTNH